jgi:hypothetical protein
MLQNWKKKAYSLVPTHKQLWGYFWVRISSNPQSHQIKAGGRADRAKGTNCAEKTLLEKDMRGEKGSDVLG